MTAGKESAGKTNAVGLTIDEIRGAIIEDRTTATALATEFYDRIRKEDSEIGAFLTLCEERALKQAGLIDQMAAEGQPLPPLAGVPVAIKDVLVTRGVRTTAGSKILENFIPPYDCTAVARLEAAGAVILGKLNCDEFAMGSSTENSAYHAVHNPRGLRHRRIDSAAGLVLRRGGDVADLRPGFTLWPDRVCLVT